MAYIEITAAMVAAARQKAVNVAWAEFTDHEMETILRAAFAAGEIRSEPEPLAEINQVTIWFETGLGVEARAAEVNGPKLTVEPTELARVKFMWVTR